MKRILHLVSVKNIVVKSSFNWFKIDIHQQLRLQLLEDPGDGVSGSQDEASSNGGKITTASAQEGY